MKHGKATINIPYSRFLRHAEERLRLMDVISLIVKLRKKSRKSHVDISGFLFNSEKVFCCKLARKNAPRFRSLSGYKVRLYLK